MQRSGFRLTLRHLMIAVAVVGLARGAFGASRRLILASARFRALADEHATIEQTLLAMRPDAPLDISPGPGRRSVRFSARVVADHEAALHRKYDRAARSAWWSVEPDPLLLEPGPCPASGSRCGGSWGSWRSRP